MATNTTLLHPELSYRIVGACFRVFNQIGPGHKEEAYQRALSVALKSDGISFREQVNIGIPFDGKRVGSYRLDFLVDNSVVVEIKALERFRSENYAQVKSYLSQTGVGLGLLVRFSGDGVTIQRVLKPFRCVS